MCKPTPAGLIAVLQRIPFIVCTTHKTFQRGSPTVWNALLQHLTLTSMTIAALKVKLKTYLFSRTFCTALRATNVGTALYKCHNYNYVQRYRSSRGEQQANSSASNSNDSKSAAKLPLLIAAYFRYVTCRCCAYIFRDNCKNHHCTAKRKAFMI